MKILFLVSAGAHAMRRSVRDALGDAAPGNELRMLAPDAEAKGLRDLGIPTESWRPAGLFNVLRSVNALRAAVTRFEPDVVHAFGWTAAVVALGSLPARYSRRTLVTLQDPVRDKEMPKNFLEKRVPELLERAGAVECAYETLRRILVDVLEVDAAKVAVEPYGVASLLPPNAVRPAHRRGPVIGYGSRLDPDRAWEKSVDALVQVRRRAPDAQLWFASSGKISGLVRSHARTHGVHDALTFFEDLPMDQMFGAIDVLIAPASRDGLPFPIVEAIVNGVPVVGANVPGIADTLRPFTGWIVDDDAAGIASGVLEAWADIDAVWLAAQAQRAEAGAFYSPERRREHLLSTYARLSDTEVGASPISR